MAVPLQAEDVAKADARGLVALLHADGADLHEENQPNGKDDQLRQAHKHWLEHLRGHMFQELRSGLEDANDSTHSADEATAEEENQGCEAPKAVGDVPSGLRLHLVQVCYLALAGISGTCVASRLQEDPRARDRGHDDSYAKGDPDADGPTPVDEAEERKAQQDRDGGHGYQHPRGGPEVLQPVLWVELRGGEDLEVNAVVRQARGVCTVPSAPVGRHLGRA
mmetsp:Transcript_81028/g.251428  ORF Transcript_81028/g.251428 Transcript_81028/m.251428 type:complete len:222 (+) Transcript_81028:960-1625(+)